MTARCGVVEPTGTSLAKTSAPPDLPQTQKGLGFRVAKSAQTHHSPPQESQHIIQYCNLCKTVGHYIFVLETYTDRDSQDPIFP